MDLFTGQLTPTEQQKLTELLDGGESLALNKDNRAVFAVLPDDSVDLILTDPPYKDYQSNRPVAHKKVRKIAAAEFDAEYFIGESARVLKPGAHFYCWCDHKTFPHLFSLIQESEKTGEKGETLIYKNCLVWVKNNHGSGDLKGNYAPQHEFIIYAVKGKGKKLNGKRQPNVIFKRTENGIEFYPKVSNYAYNHGTVKPVDILKLLIKASSEEGDIVFDPYAGVMSTAEACKNTSRRFLMVELDEENFQVGRERIK